MSPDIDMPIDDMLKQAVKDKGKELINKELQKLGDKLGLPLAPAKANETKAAEVKAEDLNKKIDAEKQKLEDKLKKGLDKLFKKK